MNRVIIIYVTYVSAELHGSAIHSAATASHIQSNLKSLMEASFQQLFKSDCALTDSNARIKRDRITYARVMLSGK